MDLTPPTSGTKRTRAKAASVSTELPKKPPRKPDVTIKPTRVRKKAVDAPVMEATMATETLTSATIGYTSDQLRGMIAMAAYYRAADRNFAPGNEMEDWLVAEQQVIANLS